MEVTPVAATAVPAAPLEAQPVQPVVERQLFDYLAEVEKSGAGHLSDPAALAKAAIHSLEGTMQQIQDTLGKAKPPAVSEGDDASANQTADTSATKGTSVEESASQLLERSMSVM